MTSPRRSLRLAVVAAVSIGTIAACGSDDDATTATDPVTTEPDASDSDTTDPVTTEPETTEPVTTEPETTEPVTTEPETTEPVTTEPETTEPGDLPGAGGSPLLIDPTDPDADPVCLAYSGMFGLSIVDVSGLDREREDLLFMASVPALASLWTDAVDSLPRDEVPAGLETTTRAVHQIFADAGQAVLRVDVSPQPLLAFETLLRTGVEPDVPYSELLSADDEAALASVDYDIDAAFDDLPALDDEALVATCPDFGAVL